MLGLIGGALSGGAQAVNNVADSAMAERRERAMERMRQKYRTSEREAGQKFQSSERVAGQEFRVDNNETQQGYAQENARLQHEMSMAQERYRQQQQNNRTEMTSRTKPQWQVVSDGEGGFLQYDPDSNTTRPVPEGVNFGGGSDLSDVQDRELDFVESEIAAMRESMSDDMGGTRQPTPEESAYMRDLTQQRQQILYGNQGGGQGGNDGPTILEQLMQGENGQQSQTESPSPVAPPPAPGRSPEQEPETSSFGGLIGNAVANQQAQTQERQTEKQNDEIEQEINQIRSLSSRAGRGPGMTQSQRNELARQAIERAEALIATGQLDDRQMERLQKAADNVVQYSDLELN